MISTKPRPRKCRVCGDLYIRLRPMQVTCLSFRCQQEYALAHLEKVKAKEAKARRKDTKIKLDAIKTLPQLKTDAQKAFNAFIRMRDLIAGHACICCGIEFGKQTYGGAVDCGHYRSVGSAPHLRFKENNAHAQLKSCNRFGSGRAVDYRLGLITRIGLEAVEALEADNTPRRYTKDELRALAALYRAKLKALTKANQ